jgi:hypothetical protein
LVKNLVREEEHWTTKDRIICEQAEEDEGSPHKTCLANLTADMINHSVCSNKCSVQSFTAVTCSILLAQSQIIL